MRQSAARRLLEGPPETAVSVLGDWISHVHSDSTGQCIAALDAISIAITTPGMINYETRSELYRAAREADLEEVALLFFDQQSELKEEEVLRKTLVDERPIEPRGRPLTLGERKSLARGPRREVLQKLLIDPHPQVVELLLENPAMTERDILVIASRRPCLPETLVTVYSSSRFRARYPVRRALANNPHTPIPLVARIMVGLRDRDLHEIGADHRRPTLLRLHARRLMAVRRGS